MAKKLAEKEIVSVELKDPNQTVTAQNIGLVINKENLTIERYKRLVSVSHKFAEFFNVKYQTKKDELQTKE